MEKATVNKENSKELHSRREVFSQPCDLVMRKGKTMVCRYMDYLGEKGQILCNSGDEG